MGSPHGHFETSDCTDLQASKTPRMIAMFSLCVPGSAGPNSRLRIVLKLSELKPPDLSLVSALRIESSGFYSPYDKLRTEHKLSAATRRRSAYRTGSPGWLLGTSDCTNLIRELKPPGNVSWSLPGGVYFWNQMLNKFFKCFFWIRNNKWITFYISCDIYNRKSFFAI